MVLKKPIMAKRKQRYHLAESTEPNGSFEKAARQRGRHPCIGADDLGVAGHST
jgi:hypothetical protein